MGGGRDSSACLSPSLPRAHWGGLEGWPGPGQGAIGPHSLSRLSHVVQSWAEITSQTEGLSRLLRQHAEDLNSGPLSKLGLLIRERQQLRKTYSEQWQQLQQDLTKVGRWPWAPPAVAAQRLRVNGLVLHKSPWIHGGSASP